MESSDPTAAPTSPSPGGRQPDAEIRPRRYQDPASALQGRVLDGRYAIDRRVGEGGMAYVYRATDLLSKELVAIKVLMARLVNDRESVARLRREADLATKLDHPNVCGLLAHGEADGLPYLVMPYLDGETLAVRESRIGRIPPVDAVPILIQICEGIQHAHDQGVLHRDLKPENVMLVKSDSGERTVVMDFGLGKEHIVGTELDRLTATGIVLGTPEFMSPEQIRGKPLDPRSDGYAVGVLGFELLTAQLPFAGGTAQETMLNHLGGRPRKLREVEPSLPASLERIIDKALSLDPADRFGSLGAMAEALRNG